MSNKESRLQAAIDAIASTSLSIREAAERYDIPKSTLYDHVSGKKRCGVGRPTVFTVDEEKAIVRSCQVLAEAGFSLNRFIVGNVIHNYISSRGLKTPFKDGVPGKKWWKGFLSRWPSLVERTPQHFPVQRALAATSDVIDKFFENLKDTLEKNGLLSLSHSELGRRIWNCDETGICTSVASKKVLATRGEKNVHETSGGSGREYITILACGSAIGEKLPPYVIYKGKNLMANHTQGGPPGTFYSMSCSGWMETANFHEWFVKMFLTSVSDIVKTGPVVLFLDGHKSHITLQLIEMAKEHNVIIYVFPPHTTHILQPLDVGVFKPLKSVWSQVLKTYTLETMAARVDRLIFPSLLAKMWPNVLLPEHLIGGFRGTGVHPLSRDAIPNSQLKTSTPFQQASQSSSSNNTPVTLRIARFFGDLFENKDAKVNKKRGRTEPNYYGEALTEDEVLSRIRQEEENRKAKRRKVGCGRKHKNENVCQGCNGCYQNDDEEDQRNWIGCDEKGCWRWYHYWCAGELDIPDPKLKWTCPACKLH